MLVVGEVFMKELLRSKLSNFLYLKKQVPTLNRIPASNTILFYSSSISQQPSSVQYIVFDPLGFSD
ncbi:hypothetical protein A21D_00633 [Virgibacillus dokdonensis]|uniref:Uncharacterized protein n=1 Tax=Virgibacillus dokdonensis TaxID=302167 RepID=A0A2K9IVG7_9BACI|nr:hypothetical protein A21D_00633 [Virgibacillus dokdonensis]